MIRILHTADWHLGQTFFGYDRTEEQEHFLTWLAATIKEQNIDALLLAGDVFDVSNPSAASQRLFYRFIQQITAENPALQLVVIAGNHDSAARLEAPLPLLQEMRTRIKGVVRKRDGEIDYDDLILELTNREGVAEVLCLAVPFLRQGDYPVVETDGNAYAEGVRELYARLVQRAVERRTQGQALVAVGHLQATGSEIAERDFSERTVIGGLECVPPDAFPEQIAYTALGHIHKSQRVSGREHVRYAGSPLPMSFAEKHYRHGVVVVTLDQGQLLTIEKHDCPLLVPLLSIPATEAASPESVLEQLAALPTGADRTLPAPYLEVKVLLDEPEPLLRQQIEHALEEKHVRLARIVSVYRSGDAAATQAEEPGVGLREMSPLQIVQSTFERTYQTEMPEELVTLFQEACLSISLKEEEEKA
ncbi:MULTISPECIES: exonuclease SbcCD subunit D [Bacteroides]|uniref:exonuclease SbcCD subunit D n=1 Tax=Bacteroides TaxID=816 RepID=UPI0004B65240|nr:exonuclease SbcCD subunit D C-terminal domain-containing protein [Bacteroides neonati]